MQLRNIVACSLVVFSLVVISPLLTGADNEQVIQQVSANGQRNLRPFAVKNKWEIQWDSKGTLLTITVFDADGEIIGIAATQQGAGKGSSYQAKGGNYYLQVNGTGEWTVTVVQLP